MTSWQTLGTVSSQELDTARVELHHAAQLVGVAVGRSLAAPQPDDSHTNLHWSPDHQLWTSTPIQGTDGLCAGLRPADLALLMGTTADPASSAFPLAGTTQEEALAWLRAELTFRGVDGSQAKLDIPYADEMPPHPVFSGRSYLGAGAYTGEGAEGREEVARWFTNSTLLMGAITARRDDATTAGTWPHHFDLGMLYPVGPAEDRHAKTVGAGMKPADVPEGYSEPYLYVYPWPEPDPSELKLPELPLGHWHTEGWFGAVLTATDLLTGTADAASQQARAEQFLAAAEAGCEEILR